MQEVSAIAMDNESYQILSVYHRHANCDFAVDKWSRRHIHGLNRSYLRTHGFENEGELILDFERWLRSLNVVQMFANDPAKERKLFPSYTIQNVLLPNWQERISQPYHIVAHRFKELAIPILNKQCEGYVHCEYVGGRCYVLANKTQATKLLHGYHCSLYDCYEMYLYHLLRTRYL